MMAECTTLATRTHTKVPETRILLVGKTGAGKSATANSLLGRKAFETSLAFQSQTTRTQCAEHVISGRRLVVVDTPGFYDTSRNNDFIMQELITVFAFLTPGPHALIFVMGPERLTRESIRTRDLFLKTFGPLVLRFTIILVTGLDRIEEEGGTFQNFVEKSGPDFQQFLKDCNGRVIGFNNKAKGESMERQISDLFNILDLVQSQNRNMCFTNIHFQAMKMYRKTKALFGKDKINKARSVMFKRIAKRHGVDKQYKWRNTAAQEKSSKSDTASEPLKEPEKPETDVKNSYKEDAVVASSDTVSVVSIAIETQTEDTEELETKQEIFDSDYVADSDDDIAERERLRNDLPYVQKIISFFLSLFRPLRNFLFKSDSNRK